MSKSRTLYTVGTVIGIVFISLIAREFFSEKQEVQEEVDVTEKIVKLDLGANIQINQLFQADIICLLPADLDAVAYLKVNFPGKTSLRDHDYDVTDSEGNWHIIAIEDRKPVSRIFDVYRGMVELDIDPEININRENFCSRNRVVMVKYNGSRRLVSIVDAGHI